MTDLPEGSRAEDGGRPEEAGPAGPGTEIHAPAVPATEIHAPAPAGIDLPAPTRPGIDLPGPRRVRDAWRRARTPGRIGLALASIAALVLLGAFLFGFWHVLFGGLVKGNWRAGGFGIALASACGVLLWIDAIVLRRLGARG